MNPTRPWDGALEPLDHALMSAREALQVLRDVKGSTRQATRTLTVVRTSLQEVQLTIEAFCLELGWHRGMPTPLWTIEDATAYLQVSRVTLYRYIQTRQFPSIRMGGDYRFRQAEIDEWLQQDQKGE